MNLLGQRIFFAGVAAITLVGLASPVAAQQIHRYGEAPAGSAGTTQGVSAQQVSAASPTAPAAQQDGQASEEPAGHSGEVRMSAAGRANNMGARQTLDLTIDKLYRGVIPGMRDSVAHLSRARTKGQDESNRNELTWLGFEPTDAYTRVFFQTARKADYKILRKQNPAQVEITLNNTEIAARNFSRFIDTSFFERNVKRVETTKIDASTLKITIELGNFVQPTVRESDNYVYFDFPNDSAKAAAPTRTESAAPLD